MLWGILSVILNFLLSGVIIILLTATKNLLLENEEQKLKLKTKNDVIANERTARLIMTKSKSTPPAFDAKTMSLLNMAVKNSNDNESRNAAKEACKLIYKKLNG